MSVARSVRRYRRSIGVFAIGAAVVGFRSSSEKNVVGVDKNSVIENADH